MKPITDLEIALGGVNYTAKLRDGSIAEVKVRQLPIRLLDKWAQLIGNEAALVELYCEKDEGWDDLLIPESHREIIELGDTLNRPLFAAWTESRQAAITNVKETQAPLLAALGLTGSSTPLPSSSAELPAK